jgi:hypothetical protein
MELYDVVKKLLGPIEPVGESNADDKRFENLDATVNLVARLLNDICDVVQYKDCQEYSRSRAGKRAKECLGLIKERLE